MRFRPLRWIVRLLAALLILLAIGALVLQTPWAHERARRLIESRVTRLLNGELRVGALTGSFWGGVTLANVSIVQAGTPVISVASIDVRYRPWQVFRAGVVDDVILTGLRADIVENADGWNIAGLAAPRPPSTGPGPSISIDRLQLVASEVDIRPRDATPRRIVELNLLGALKIQSRTTRITIEEATARDASTGLPIRELAGVLRFQERTMAVDALRLATARSRLTGQVSMTTLPTGREVDVALEAAPISVPELAAYFPQLAGVTVVPTARITLRGPLDRLQVSVVAQDPAGRINASGQTGFAEGVQFKGAVELAGTNLAAWLGRPGLAGRVTGRADVDLRWVSGTAERLRREVCRQGAGGRGRQLPCRGGGCARDLSRRRRRGGRIRRRLRRPGARPLPMEPTGLRVAWPCGRAGSARVARPPRRAALRHRHRS